MTKYASEFIEQVLRTGEGTVPSFLLRWNRDGSYEVRDHAHGVTSEGWFYTPVTTREGVVVPSLEA